MKSFIEYIKFLIKKGIDFMSEMLKGMGIKNISITYAQAIVEGWKTFNKVPKYFKSDCAVALIVLFGAEDKITDQKYLDEAKQRITEAQQEDVEE